MRPSLIQKLALVGALAAAVAVRAHEPAYTSDFARERCSFTSVGSNPYFPLWPGYTLSYSGVEEDEGEEILIELEIAVTTETLLVDGVETRVLVESEWEDGEIKEIARNYFAHCRETGDVWYFGEDVDNYEDGEIANHNGSWHAGEGGAEPGILMMGSPMLGARYAQEIAPGIAEDRGEVTAVGAADETPAGAFEGVLTVLDTDALKPEETGDPKQYAPGVGLIRDVALELDEIEDPPCKPGPTAHCLNDGRFRVSATWEDFEGHTGDAQAILGANDSGEFWFFDAGNTELLVKVLDACTLPTFESYWVFAGGLTNVGVTLTVEDTKSGQVRTYSNVVDHDFAPVLDTSAFATCP